MSWQGLCMNHCGRTLDSRDSYPFSYFSSNLLAVLMGRASAYLTQEKKFRGGALLHMAYYSNSQVPCYRTRPSGGPNLLPANARFHPPLLFLCSNRNLITTWNRDRMWRFLMFRNKMIASLWNY